MIRENALPSRDAQKRSRRGKGESLVVGCPNSALWVAGLSLARAGLSCEVKGSVLAVRLVTKLLDTPSEVGDSVNDS